MIERCPLAGLVVALVVVAAPVRAQEAERVGVSLEVDDCVDADAAVIRRHFFVELGTSVPADVEDKGAARVLVGCDGPLILLRVDDGVTGKSLERRIEAGARPGRERLLALAAMELLVASWIELEAVAEPVAEPAQPPVAEPERRSARSIARQRLARPRWTTTAAALGSASWADDVVYGGGVRVARDRRRWGFAVDALVEAGATDVELGTVRLTVASASLTGHWRRRLGRAVVRAALGARIGSASMTGEAARPQVSGRSLQGVIGGPLSRVGLDVGIASGAALAVSIESGWHLLTMRGLIADGDASRQGRALDGVWVTAHAGVAWSF